MRHISSLAVELASLEGMGS